MENHKTIEALVFKNFPDFEITNFTISMKLLEPLAALTHRYLNFRGPFSHDKFFIL
ncbi:hypothetical protein BGX21_006018, partial [Mortierella sp. AD011]